MYRIVILYVHRPTRITYLNIVYVHTYTYSLLYIYVFTRLHYYIMWVLLHRGKMRKTSWGPPTCALACRYIRRPLLRLWVHFEMLQKRIVRVHDQIDRSRNWVSEYRGKMSKLFIRKSVR